MILLITSCDGGKKGSDSLLSIDIKGNINKMEIINLSQFSNSIRYVPFEYKEDFSFTNYPQFDISGNLVLVSNFTNCYLYNNDGKIIANIGKKGRGPGKYQYISNLGFAENNKIFISSLYDIVEYNIDGTFMNKYTKSILINDSLSFKSWRIINDSLIFGHIPNSTGKIKFKAMIIDKYGSVKNKYNNYILCKRNSPVAGGLEDFAHINLFNGSVFYKELFNDSLFTLNDHYEMIPRYYFNLGNLKMPASDRVKSPIGQIILQYVFVYEIFQTDKYLFLKCDFGNRFPSKRLTSKQSIFPGGDPVWINTTYALGIFNKQTGDLTFSKPTTTDNPLFTSGLYNDIDGGPRFFPKMQVNDSTMVMWIKADELKNHVASDEFKNNIPKYPEKKKELEKLANGLKETDNPVLMIVRLKK